MPSASWYVFVYFCSEITLQGWLANTNIASEIRDGRTIVDRNGGGHCVSYRATATIESKLRRQEHLRAYRL